METVKMEMHFISRLLDFSPYIKSLTCFYLHTIHNNHVKGLGNLHALWLAYKWEELATITHILSEEGMAQHPLIRRAREGAGLSQTTGKRCTFVDACKPSLNAQAADRYIWQGGYVECCGYHPSGSRHFISPGSMNVDVMAHNSVPTPRTVLRQSLHAPSMGVRMRLSQGQSSGLNSGHLGRATQIPELFVALAEALPAPPSWFNFSLCTIQLPSLLLLLPRAPYLLKPAPHL